ncbi:hypothetical protein PIB30_022769 [Stylosanthes scabra]|uniref:Obg domain-containing protein n=1 Tax=Stylosanthes scabra TaxID=79078 RepID=A0ABU6S9J2_9FABA|nr:hypothetical protein [Stylosanthes scabra]
MVALRREKYVPFGGPYGGDRGRREKIYVEVDGSMNSLLTFRKSVHFRTERGTHGHGRIMSGAKGEDVDCDGEGGVWDNGEKFPMMTLLSEGLEADWDKVGGLKSGVGRDVDRGGAVAVSVMLTHLTVNKATRARALFFFFFGLLQLQKGQLLVP